MLTIATTAHRVCRIHRASRRVYSKESADGLHFSLSVPSPFPGPILATSHISVRIPDSAIAGFTFLPTFDKPEETKEILI
jgi:hypothetical protein